MSFKLSALAWNVEVDKSADRLVLLALASKADDNGRNCFPSVESICGLTVLNRKTVFAVISRLADRGLITVRKRVSTNSNEYLLHVDRWTENGSAENGTTVVPKTGRQSYRKRDTTLSILSQILSQLLNQRACPRKRCGKPIILTTPSKRSKSRRQQEPSQKLPVLSLLTIPSRLNTLSTHKPSTQASTLRRSSPSSSTSTSRRTTSSAIGWPPGERGRQRQKSSPRAGRRAKTRLTRLESLQTLNTALGFVNDQRFYPESTRQKNHDEPEKRQ